METQVGTLLCFSLPMSTDLTINRSIVFIIGPRGLLPKKEPGYNYEYIYYLSLSYYTYSSAPLSMWNMFQDSQQMPETVNSTEYYIYYAFPYTYLPMINFNL